MGQEDCIMWKKRIEMFDGGGEIEDVGHSSMI